MGGAERVLRVSAARGGPEAARQARRARRTVVRFCDALGLGPVELSLSFVRDAEIRALNRAWRNKDTATDVLSFPAGDSPAPGPKLLGDVVISLQTAQRQARAWRRPLDEEVARYLAHGLLHLLGHDHHRREEAARMREHEERLLGAPGMLGPARLAHRRGG